MKNNLCKCGYITIFGKEKGSFKVRRNKMWEEGRVNGERVYKVVFSVSPLSQFFLSCVIKNTNYT